MGYIEIWGNIVPNLLAQAGRAIKEVAEKIPLSGFKLKDSVVFGLTAKTTEPIEALADSVVFGATRFQSEDLQGSMDESVTITNV
jgi:hypothetical protein